MIEIPEAMVEEVKPVPPGGKCGACGKPCMRLFTSPASTTKCYPDADGRAVTEIVPVNACRKCYLKAFKIAYPGVELPPAEAFE